MLAFCTALIRGKETEKSERQLNSFYTVMTTINKSQEVTTELIDPDRTTDMEIVSKLVSGEKLVMAELFAFSKVVSNIRFPHALVF